MISFLRHAFVDSWLGRVIAGLLFLAFVGWGVGDVLSNMGSERADVVAHVGPNTITTDAFMGAVQNEMPQVARQMGLADASQIPAATRREAARQVLQRLVMQSEIALSAERHGLIVPDDVLRDEVFGLRDFKGPDGRFDRKLFDARLRQIGMTEGRLLDLVRMDISSRALMEPIRNSVRAPETMVRRAFDFDAQTRTLDLVRIAPGDQSAPTPEPAQMRRFYDNHPWLFQTPEYRHARIVVLSPETIARSMEVPEVELHRLYDAEQAKYHLPETRTVQIVTAPDEARARAIATQWQAGATWAQVQAAAKDSASVQMDGVRAVSIPSAPLSKMVFAAPVDSLQGPAQTDTGWVVFKVTQILPPHDTDFAAARQELHDQIAQAHAGEQIGGRVQQLQDAIAGSGLDRIPDTLGASATSGTLDAQGRTQAGEPAPIPASGEARQAILARIFSQAKGANPSLIQGPDQTWYAVSVDSVTPGQVQPFSAISDQAGAAWQDEARRHAANIQATDLYLAAKTKGGVAQAAPAGQVVHSAPLARGRQTTGVPDGLAQLAFRIGSIGQSVMVEESDGFYVATLTAITQPDPSTQRMLIGRIRTGLSQSMAEDIEMSYAMALQNDVKPKTNMAAVQSVLSSVTGPDGAEGGAR
ncbi:peptidylprolyl isomerase [Gluconacetobacter azotocaptans]|uniref:Parvulin-like PPIase n=1 Tax=Gluconacetobacter azotocaptans TaxID=142834 RepID=A0A7W4JU35_9PROT|nr:peptidylprolyl isomerase [Gluconacetobacter azotocaptans]MBB2190924.1 peptidylprolyl isomerase [Gluconacetobacter azotocaptans]MBM9401719.1 peptidylprolyl isomerase [Gluconacetobacter azotocaptans]GBQ31758.1 peptidyl-prolyl cis-trans isomerase [Gluconacetobacter azotocaptans DSM 13594]